jgi:hypothetical protein
MTTLKDLLISILLAVFMTCYMLISFLVKFQILILIYYSVLRMVPPVYSFRFIIVFTILAGVFIKRNMDFIMMDITILLEAIRGL